MDTVCVAHDLQYSLGCAWWLRVPIGARQFEERLTKINTAATRHTRRVTASFARLKSAGREATGVARTTMRVRHSVCLHCGRTDRPGFADETRRQSRYGIAAVIACPCQVEIVSKVMRGSVPRYTRRVHFSKLPDRDRRLVASQLTQVNIRALYVTESGVSFVEMRSREGS